MSIIATNDDGKKPYKNGMLMIFRCIECGNKNRWVVMEFSHMRSIHCRECGEQAVWEFQPALPFSDTGVDKES